MSEEQKGQTGWTQEQTDSLHVKSEMLGTMRLLEKQRDLAEKLGRISPFLKNDSDEEPGHGNENG